MVVGIRTRGPTDHAVENRTHRVLGALANLMADLALSEDFLAGGGILRRRGAYEATSAATAIEKLKTFTFSSLFRPAGRADRCSKLRDLAIGMA